MCLLRAPLSRRIGDLLEQVEQGNQVVATDHVDIQEDITAVRTPLCSCVDGPILTCFTASWASCGSQTAVNKAKGSSGAAGLDLGIHAVQHFPS